MTDPGLAGDGFGLAGLAALAPALAVCGLVPGWLAATALGARGGFVRLGLAVVLSALVTGVAGVVSLAVTGGVAAAATGLTILAAGLAASAFFARPLAWPARPRASWSGAAVAAFTLLVVAVFVANPELRHRVDGWFHGAVTARLLAVGLPPDDPYFAGQRLAYPWAWHVILATTAQAGARLGVSAFDAMAGWSALAALATGAWLVVLGRAWAGAAGLGAAGADRVGAFAVALGVLGANPLGALFWLGRGLAGHEGGLAELVRPLSRGASEAMLATTWNYPHVSLASPLDKFLTPTAFGLGEATMLGFGAVALFPAVAPGGRGVVLAAALALVALLVHGAAALAIGLLVVAALVLALRDGGADGRRRALGLAAAFAAAVVAAAPYLAATRGPLADGRVLPAVRADLLAAIVLVGGLVIGLAALAGRRFGRAAWGPRAGLLGAFLLLVVAGGVTLMQRNETKLVNLALLALAAPAALTVARLRPAAAVALLALLVPSHAVAVAGFALDPGAETPGRRVPPPALREAYAWIGAHTRPRDVFLEAVPAGARDPDRDLLVHGPRALAWGGLGYASNWGYPAASLEPRRRAAEALAAGAIDAATLRALAAEVGGPGRTLYAVRRGPGAAARPLPGGGATWSRVFASDALALDRLDAEAGR